jgi:glycosyltransferase involved in cell wall biosynthesis
VFVAPLRYGAGIRGKIGESAAFGLPVVSTRLGVEGLALEPGRDILVADSAQDFAAAVVRAYKDSQLWTRLAANGRRAIALQCAPDVIRSRLAKILTGELQAKRGVHHRRGDPPAPPDGAADVASRCTG